MKSAKINNSNANQIKDLLAKFERDPIDIAEAETFLRGWCKKSNPILIKCQNGKKYVVKGKKSAGRQIINDQIVARLGCQIKAPVGRPEIINISKDLIEIEPSHFADFDAGTAHGTEFIPDCFDSYNLRGVDVKENRIRLVTLALIFGWTHANDHQFIYQRPAPYTIHSVDHGHFFPNPPDWQIKDLENDSTAILDAFFDQCNFVAEELNTICDIVKNVTELMIVKAVSFPRTDWGITLDERLGMINYLTNRKKELQKHLEFRLG